VPRDTSIASAIVIRERSRSGNVVLQVGSK
jgi:hypothetical protein